MYCLLLKFPVNCGESHIQLCSSGQNFVLDTLHMLQGVSEVILGAS